MRTIMTFICCLVLCAVYMPLHAQGIVSTPYSEMEGSVVISEFHTLDNPSTAEGIFLNALLWMIENKEPECNVAEEEKSVFEVDYDKKQYATELVLANAQNTSRYRCSFSAKVADNIVTVLASHITYEAETNVIKLVKRLPFEKLQPEKKPKHKEYLQEFAALHKKTIKQMLEAITKQPAPSVTHWTEIKEKNVVKGMNKSECLLAFGKPASIQRQGNKEEWMYNSYTYVFFEDGIVSSLIK